MNITQQTVSCQRQKRIVIYKKTTINGLLTPNTPPISSKAAAVRIEKKMARES